MKGKMSCNNTDSRKDWLGRSSAKENLRILVNSKLKMIQMHALAAKSTSCLGALTGGIQEALGQVKQLYCSTHRFGFGAVSTGRTEISWSSAESYRTFRRLKNHLRRWDRRNWVSGSWTRAGFGETYKAAQRTCKEAKTMQQWSTGHGGRTNTGH